MQVSIEFHHADDSRFIAMGSGGVEVIRDGFRFAINIDGRKLAQIRIVRESGAGVWYSQLNRRQGCFAPSALNLPYVVTFLYDHDSPVTDA